MTKKSLFITLVSTLLSLSMFAQSNLGFNYQALARDNNGDPLLNTGINLRFFVIEVTVGGPIIYQETHAPTTNGFGLFNVLIGKGATETGDFNAIDWASNPHFLIVELNGSKIDTTQLEAVPYSKVATSMNLENLLNVEGTATNGQVLRWDGSNWTPSTDVDTDSTNELQSLAFSGDTLSLSDGNFVKIAPSPWSFLGGNNIFYNSGNVGIGLSDPIYPLHVGINDDVVFGSDLANTGSKFFYDASRGALRIGRTNQDILSNDSIALYSFASGFEPVAEGDYSVALNSRTRVYGNLGFAAGLFTYSDDYLQATFGRYNSRGNGSKNTWVATDDLFVIGNGTSNTNRNNALTLHKNGFLGLNEDNPSYFLDMENNDLSTRSIFIDHNSTSASSGTQYGVYLDLDKTSTASNSSVYGYFANTLSTGGAAYGAYGWGNSDASNTSAAVGVRAIVDNDNGSGVAYSLYASVFSSTTTGSKFAGYFSGNVFTTGTYQPSDVNLKDNIQPASSTLGKLLQLQISNYSYRRDVYPDMNLPKGTRTGFMAQDVARLMPELVETATQPAATAEELEGGATQLEDVHFQAVDYAGMVPYLVKAIQEQQAQIEALKAEIKALKNKN